MVILESDSTQLQLDKIFDFPFQFLVLKGWEWGLFSLLLKGWLELQGTDLTCY